MDLTRNRYSSQYIPRKNNAIGFDPIAHKWGLIETKLSGSDSIITVVEMYGRPQIAFTTTVPQEKQSQGIASAKKFIDSEESKASKIFERYISELKKVKDLEIAMDKIDELLDSSGYVRGEISFEPGSSLYKPGLEPKHTEKSKKLLKDSEKASIDFQMAVSKCVDWKNKSEANMVRMTDEQRKKINLGISSRPSASLATKLGL
jgi:hypothetical protein